MTWATIGEPLTYPGNMTRAEAAVVLGFDPGDAPSALTSSVSVANINGNVVTLRGDTKPASIRPDISVRLLRLWNVRRMRSHAEALVHGGWRP